MESEKYRKRVRNPEKSTNLEGWWKENVNLDGEQILSLKQALEQPASFYYNGLKKINKRDSQVRK